MQALFFAFSRSSVRQNIGRLLLLNLLAITAILCGCSERNGQTYQGYAEGEFIYLNASQPGKLTHLAVQRGQTVAARALAFELDGAEAQANLEQAKQQLAVELAQLADMQTGKRQAEIDVAQAQLKQAVVNARKAALQLSRSEAQYRIGAIAKGQLDDTRALTESANAQVLEAENQLKVAQLPSREQQIRAQSAQIEAARAAVTQAQWKVDERHVSIPAPGLIYDTLYRVGEWVPAGNPVVQMLLPENTKVRFFVPEAARGSLAAGRNILIHCNGCASDIPAKVTYISTTAEYTPPIIYSKEMRAKLVFLVEAHPAPADALKLHAGQPVSIRLQ